MEFRVYNKLLCNYKYGVGYNIIIYFFYINFTFLYNNLSFLLLFRKP